MVDTIEYEISIGHMSLKGACGKLILIVVGCCLLAATSIIDLGSSSFSSPIVVDVVEGLSLTTCVVRTSCADTLWVSWPSPLVDWPLEDNQLIKRWRSWEIDVTLAAIFRNCVCCTDNSHCCFVGVGYWCNLTRESSKSFDLLVDMMPDYIVLCTTRFVDQFL